MSRGSSSQHANGRRSNSHHNHRSSRSSSHPLNPHSSRIAHLLHFDQYDRTFTFISPVVKYFLFFFNLIVWVCGCLLITLGAWSFLEEYNDTLISIRNVFDVILHISLAIIVFGTIVFSMSFAGCIGALRENLFLLKIYSLMLLILFIGEVIISAMAFMFPNSFLYHVKETLSRDPIIKYRDDPNLQNIIDVIQTEFRCCGISDKGYKDWSKNIYFECIDTNPSRERCAVPYSCCRNPRNLDSGLINIECGFNMQNISSVVEVNKDIYTRGCIEAITETLEPNMNIVSAVCFTFAIVQLFAMFLARSLQGQISAQQSRWLGR